MTPAEAFQVGFLLRCAEEGLPPERVDLRVKFAHAVATGNAPAPATTTKQADGLGTVMTGLLLAAGIGAPVASYMLGSNVARGRSAMLADTKLDAASMRQAEILREYNQQMQVLQNAAASRHRRLKPARGVRGPRIVEGSATRV